MIFGETLIPPKEKSSLEKSLNQIILGNYTDDVTELGTAGQILLGFTGLDVITDIRDLSHDMINWEWSWSHAGKTALDAIGLIPVIGSVKNADEAASIVNGVAKHGDEALDSGGKIVKHGDQLVEGVGSKVNPNDIRFSQSSVNGAEEITNSMKSNGWKGDPIDVVRMPDGRLTTLDNTRVVAARQASIDVQANIRGYNDPLPSNLVDRFTTKNGIPTTWGEALELRIGKQNATFRNTYPSGSFDMPKLNN